METTFYERFLTTTNEEQLAQEIKSLSYKDIYDWITRLTNELEIASEGEFARLEELIQNAATILPDPQSYSPSWDGIWTELQAILEIKQQVFKKIPPQERDGEWQLLFDNPFSTEGMVNHVNLTFDKAAYMFAKYRKDLAKLEYVSLQKVQRFITENGDA